VSNAILNLRVPPSRGLSQSIFSISLTAPADPCRWDVGGFIKLFDIRVNPDIQIDRVDALSFVISGHPKAA
jgi:hypothetical protein